MNANTRAEALLWGKDGAWWDWWMILSLATVAIAGFAVFIFTYGAIVVHKREARAAEEQLAGYKLATDGKVADASKAGIEAGRSASGAMLKAAEANRKAAELEKEAASARLETERLRANLAPRRITSDQLNMLISLLKKGNIGKIFVVSRDEDEPRQYADQLVKGLYEAGLLDDYIMTNSPGNRWTGIVLYIGKFVDPTKFESDILVNAFRKAGIEISGIRSGSQSGVVIDPQLQRVGKPTVYIGFKPLLPDNGIQ